MQLQTKETLMTVTGEAAVDTAAVVKKKHPAISPGA
jgi:hypothetical protein